MERKWWTLIAVSVAIFMLLLDITVVNVALPDIQRSLHSSFSDLQWVVNAYSLTLAAFLLTAGSLADLVGRRRVFVLGLIVFTAASAACGLSSSPLALNLFRAVQGTGGAMMFATSLALIASAFHGPERGLAFGVYGGVIGAAVAVGPVIGGVITQGIGWEWIFFVNVPIGIAAVFLTLNQVQESRDPNARGVDWIGLVTFSGALFTFVLALIKGNEKGWGSTEIVSLLVASVLLLAIFLVAETRQQRPMLDLSLFKKPAFTGASLVALAISSSMFSMFLYLTLYIQDVLGYDPLQAGLRFLPITLISFVVAPISGKNLRIGPDQAADRLRPAARQRRPVEHDRDRRELRLDDARSRLPARRRGHRHDQPAARLDRRRRRAPLRAAAWPRASTTPSARSGSRPASQASAPIFQHQVASKTTRRARLDPGRGTRDHLPTPGLLPSPRLGRRAPDPRTPPALRPCRVLHAYRVGFTGALTTILLVASAIALLGAIAAFALIRTRDFVSSQQEPGPEGEARPTPRRRWRSRRLMPARRASSAVLPLGSTAPASRRTPRAS